jgi:hypothetical protein
LRLAIGDDDYQAYTERLGDDRQITPPARTFMLDPDNEYRHRPMSRDFIQDRLVELGIPQQN